MRDNFGKKEKEYKKVQKMQLKRVQLKIQCKTYFGMYFSG